MDAFVTDPVVARSCGALLAVVLLTGAWQKLRDLAVFRAQVELYRLLPEVLVGVFALALPVLEVAAGTALLFEASRGTGLALTLAVLGVSTAGVVINLLRGHTAIDCGCGGAQGHTELSWALPARNAVLLALAVVAGQPGSDRALMWIDYLSVAGATLALLALYATANQLIANQPRLAQLRSGS